MPSVDQLFASIQNSLSRGAAPATPISLAWQFNQERARSSGLGNRVDDEIPGITGPQSLLTLWYGATGRGRRQPLVPFGSVQVWASDHILLGWAQSKERGLFLGISGPGQNIPWLILFGQA